jgi:hypothetical protein
LSGIRKQDRDQRHSARNRSRPKKNSGKQDKRGKITSELQLKSSKSDFHWPEAVIAFGLTLTGAWVLLLGYTLVSLAVI